MFKLNKTTCRKWHKRDITQFLSHGFNWVLGKAGLQLIGHFQLSTFLGFREALPSVCGLGVAVAVAWGNLYSILQCTVDLLLIFFNDYSFHGPPPPPPLSLSLPPPPPLYRCSCWRKGTCAWLTPPANLSFIQQREREEVRKEGGSVEALHWRARGNGSGQHYQEAGTHTERTAAGQNPGRGSDKRWI